MHLFNLVAFSYQVFYSITIFYLNISQVMIGAEPARGYLIIIKLSSIN
jgi:hypothetical protein